VADTAVLDGFVTSPFTALGRTRPVHRLGDGPAVLVLSEMPGITPLVAQFSRTVVDAGFSVAMPHLFGTDGAEPTMKMFRQSLRQVCVSREFYLLASNKSAPVTRWLTALAHHEHERAGGPGVGVVGMCLTGGFALGMMVDPVVVAPVLSQPSLPAAMRATSPRRGALQLSDPEKAAVKARAEAGQCVLGLRFTGDKLAPPERFAALRDLLGDKFIGVEIDSSASNPWGYKERAHSVLTEDLGTNPDSPTAHALAQVLQFFADNLQPGSAGR
jgi:dienelactone hydrolase